LFTAPPAHEQDPELKMGRKNKGRTAFTLVVESAAAPVRKPFAPAVRPMADARRKPPRRKPDHLAETDDLRSL